MSSKVLVWLGLALVPLVLGGCTKRQPAEHPVVKLAEFDLQCPRGQLLYTPIDKRNLGVEGCGRRTRYVKVCRGTDYGDDCRWIQN